MNNTFMQVQVLFPASNKSLVNEHLQGFCFTQKKLHAETGLWYQMPLRDGMKAECCKGERFAGLAEILLLVSGQVNANA